MMLLFIRQKEVSTMEKYFPYEMLSKKTGDGCRQANGLDDQPADPQI